MQIRTLIACTDSQEAIQLANGLEDVDGGRFACIPTWLEAAAAVAGLHQADVGVLDHAAGFKLIGYLARRHAGTRWLVRGPKCSPQDVLAAVSVGVRGWIERGAEMRLFARAIRITHEGGHWFGRSELFNALQPGVPQIRVAPRPDSELTPREREILHLIGEGLSNKEIGRRLQISDQTVKTHLHRVYAKLHQSGRYKAFLAQPRPIAVRAAGEGR